MCQTRNLFAGVVGDLVSGEVDLGVAALIQTSEKAEVVDFAAPYFDLSGISIALRKKVPIQSFFKFALVFTPGRKEFIGGVQGQPTVRSLAILC